MKLKQQVYLTLISQAQTVPVHPWSENSRIE